MSVFTPSESSLSSADPEVARLIEEERERQSDTTA